MQLRKEGETLQRRAADLEAQVAAQALENSSRTSNLEAKSAALKERLQDLEKREDKDKELQRDALAEAAQNSQQQDELRNSLATAEAAVAGIKEQSASKEATWAQNCSALEKRLREQAAPDALQRSEAEMDKLNDELSALQEECKNLRAALAESWSQPSPPPR